MINSLKGQKGDKGPRGLDGLMGFDVIIFINKLILQQFFLGF